jgi:hypothetical protein
LRPTLRGGAVLPLKFARPANELEVNTSSDDTPPDGGNANRPMREALSAALEFDYFQKIPALSSGADSGTNWLLAAHPDLYLFGALVEAEMFGVYTWKRGHIVYCRMDFIPGPIIGTHNGASLLIPHKNPTPEQFFGHLNLMLKRIPWLQP